MGIFAVKGDTGIKYFIYGYQVFILLINLTVIIDTFILNFHANHVRPQRAVLEPMLRQPS